MRLEWSAPTGAGLRELPAAATWQLYHEASKLTPGSAAAAAGFAASPFEVFVTSRGFHQFRDAPAVALPEPAETDDGLAAVMRRRRSRRELAAPLDLAALGAVLHAALAPTAVAHDEQTGVPHAFRAWPSAGGLYPIDAYVVASAVDGLDRGVHHHNPIRGQLERLPARDPAAILDDGFFWQSFITEAAAVVVLAASFERTVAKYGERGYRLVLLDAGHAAQNLLLAAEDLGLPAVALAGFCDEPLADDLGLDGVYESPVHAVALGGAG